MSRTNRMTSDISKTGPVERDIEQVVIALKKGAHLVKYGRRGKPKFCPFRLSNDESVLIWFSGKEEKHLKLSHVSRIISGQHTGNRSFGLVEERWRRRVRDQVAGWKRCRRRWDLACLKPTREVHDQALQSCDAIHQEEDITEVRDHKNGPK